MSRSAVVSGSTLSAECRAAAADDMASKNRTSVRISSSDKIERRHAHLQVGAHAVAIRVRGAQRRIGEEALEPFGIDARAFAGQHRRQILLVLPLILRQAHQDRALADSDLMAADAIVFRDDPPALLDGGALIGGLVHVFRRQSRDRCCRAGR